MKMDNIRIDFINCLEDAFCRMGTPAPLFPKNPCQNGMHFIMPFISKIDDSF